MSQLSDIRLVIQRDSHPAGSICTIHYGYTLSCDARDVAAGHYYRVEVELRDEEPILDMHLGKLDYDRHLLQAQDRISQSRSFTVPCEMLNAEMGRDEIYVVVRVTTPAGELLEERSEVIRERF